MAMINDQYDQYDPFPFPIPSLYILSSCALRLDSSHVASVLAVGPVKPLPAPIALTS